MSSPTSATKGQNGREKVDRETLAAQLREARGEIAALKLELADAIAHGRRLSSIFERAPFAIFVKNLEGKYLDANPMASRILRKDLDELLGMTDAELFGPSAALEIRDIDQYVIATNRPFRYEARRLTESGEQVFQTTKWPWMTDTGESVGIIAMSRDITTQKHAEEYFTLHDSISRVTSRYSDFHSAMHALLEPLRTTFGADVVFLWSNEGSTTLRLASMDVARPGFGEELIERSRNLKIQSGHGLVGRSWAENRPVVSTPEPADPRGSLDETGLKTIFTIPVVTPDEASVFEIMTPETRSGVTRFIETLSDAGQRLVDYDRLLNAEARVDLGSK